MSSNAIMVCLLCFYAAIAIASLCERNWWRALYYFAAILISISVLGMTTTRG